MTARRFVFAMEQGLGHTVHALNLERALHYRPDIEATVLKIKPGATEGVSPLPLTKNWSAQMSWATRKSLQHRLAAGPVDAAFIHTQVAALFAGAIMRNIPTVVSLDATPLDFDTVGVAYGHGRHPAPAEWAKLQINRRALNRAAAVVTWSRWTARSVTTDYLVEPERVHPIYPGVQVDSFVPNTDPDADRPMRVLFVGGDFERKGGLDLITAVSSLNGRVELDVVTSGDGEDQRSDGQVRFHHGVPPNSGRLQELYRRADVFALPTKGDCTPLVIAEAMASGLPVVASSVGSIPDMIDHGRNGLVVPPGAPGELASALALLASDADLRQRMGRESRTMAEAEHDADRNWNRVFELLSHLALSSPTASG